MSELQRWEGRFSAPGYLFGKEPNAFLESQAHRLRAGQTALAVADGEGRNSVWLAERGLDVLAIDFSPTALAKACALAGERGVQLRTEVADVTRWSWPEAAFVKGFGCRPLEGAPRVRRPASESLQGTKPREQDRSGTA